MRISFQLKNSNVADANDIMAFVNHVTDNENFKKYDRAIVSHYVWNYVDPLNCEIRITFQLWKKNEYGLGKKYCWLHQRANDHSCSHSEINFVQWSVEELMGYKR